MKKLQEHSTSDSLAFVKWKMEKHDKKVQTLFIFLILIHITTSKDEGSEKAASLWGKKVDFMQKDCGYWELKNEHKIPSLKELSVCVNIKREVENSLWTAFMYLDPNKKDIQLGMKGYGTDLHIIMFDRRWIGSSVVSLKTWHSVCMTWSKVMAQPVVYVNETKVDLILQSKKTPLHPGCCTVNGGGSLTLAVAHSFVEDKLVIETGTELKGSLSLFRLWKHARSLQEISEMACSDGDVLHWEEQIWKKDQKCQPKQDVSQHCVWPFYEVTLPLIIIREDGNKTDIYDAREVAHQWFTQALAEIQLTLIDIYLHKVRVFPLAGHTQSSGYVPFLKTSMVVMATAPGLSQFKCLAHLNVIPSADVGEMQDNLTKIFPQNYEIDHYKILTQRDLIFIYPLDDLLPTTTPQPMTKTTEMITTGETTIAATLQPTTTTSEIITTVETTTTTTPQPMTTTPEITSTAETTKTTTTSQSTSTTPEMITTAETTTATSHPTTTASETTGTTPIQIETTTTTVASSSNETTRITTSTPFMETTVHTKSSSAIKETTALTSIPTLTLSTTTYSTLSPEGIMTDSFFNVNISVTIEGSTTDAGSIIQIWLNETFSSKGISVLNFKLKFSSMRAAQRSVNTRHSCFFHAQVTTSSNVAETQNLIHRLLEQKYTSGSIYLEARPEDIFISYIGPCPEHNHYTRQGIFKWPQTSVKRITQLPCEGNPEKTAYRECLLDVNALWKSPDLGQCQVVVHSVSDLEDITVTNDNAEDILIMIEDLIHENKNLDNYELLTVLNKLADVINVSVITPPLGEVIINITSDILQSDSDLLPFTNSILKITESVGDQMLLVSGEDSVSLTAPAMAISVVNVDQEHFHNLTFGVSSTNGFNPEIYINQEPFDDTVAFISLPSEIQQRFPIMNNTSPRIQFQFYGVPTLFQTKDDPDDRKLDTYVVSASVTNATGPIENLKEYVTVTLRHLTSKSKDQDVQCVFWDFSQNDGYGGWNPKGCWTYNISSDYTTCQCDHMTHFGVLVDVSRTPIDEKNERILTLITYIGCGVSSCFLGITVLTYTLLEKLRRDYPSKILLNLSFALLGLNLVFLLNSWVSSFGIYGLCITVAATLHYFLLTSFTWMGLGAVNMYFALVKVFNVYVPSYILKFSLLGWGIPLIICGLVLAVNKDSYGMSDSQGTLDDSEMFCWVQNNVVFYVSVVSYIAFILLCNGSIFLVVLIQIRNMQVNQPAGTRSGILKDLRAVASLTFLLGLTWSVAFLAWGPVRVFLLYLFSILNSLQGFFIFVFHCLMKENVRKQWRIHLCCGAFKLLEYSEWSQTATVVPKHKPNPPHKFPLMASIKSNSTQSSTVSSESSQCQSTITRPDLGFVYENSLVIPRARTGQSPLPRDASPATANGFEFPSKQWKNGFNTDIYPE